MLVQVLFGGEDAALLHHLDQLVLGLRELRARLLQCVRRLVKLELERRELLSFSRKFIV